MSLKGNKGMYANNFTEESMKLDHFEQYGPILLIIITKARFYFFDAKYYQFSNKNYIKYFHN